LSIRGKIKIVLWWGRWWRVVLGVCALIGSVWLLAPYIQALPMGPNPNLEGSPWR